MTAMTIGRYAATGVGLGALLLLALGARTMARRRRAARRQDRRPGATGGPAGDRDAGGAADEQAEGGWSLDLTDDP
jgi:hypothetical protein